MTKQRLIEFDVLKFLAIFLVLWGHVILHLSDAPAAGNGMYNFISSFHMPLFMLISGFFASSSLKLPPRRFLSKKFFQLLWPCLSFGLLFLLLLAAIGLFDIRFSVGSFSLRGVAYYLWSGLWFLKSLFFCYAVLYVALAVCRGKSLWGGVLALVVSQIFPMFKVNSMFPFFLAGWCLSFNIDWLKAHIKAVFWVSLPAFAVFLYFLDAGIFSIMPEIKTRLLQGDFMAFKDLCYVNFYRFFLGLAGSLLVVSLVFMLLRHWHSRRMLSAMSRGGRQTLGIYIIQSFILETLMAQTMDFTCMDVYAFTYLLSPVLSLVLLFVCMYISERIRRWPRIGKLLFGQG